MSIISEGFGSLLPMAPEFAHGRSRVSDELRKLDKLFLAAVALVYAAIAKVRKRENDLADQQARLADAREEVETAVGLVRGSHVIGHPDDRGGRAMSTTAYVLLLVVIGFFQFNVDRGSLLVLELPLAVTEILAVSLVAISVLAAHWTGMIWRRAHHVVDPRTTLGNHELLTGRATLVGGVLLALVIAVVRGIYAGVLSGILFAVAGVVLFVTMCFASYLHSNSAVDRRERARRVCRHRQNGVRDAAHQLNKARADYHVACRNLVRVARSIVERIDQMILGALERHSRNNPDAPTPTLNEPAWLGALRRVADGEIPAELQLDADRSRL